MRTSLRFGDTAVSVIDVPRVGSAPVARRMPAVSRVELLFPLETGVVVRTEGAHERLIGVDEAIVLPPQYELYAAEGGAALTAAVPVVAVGSNAASVAPNVISRSAVLAPAKKFLLGVTELETEPARVSEYFIERLVVELVASIVLESHGTSALPRPGRDVVDRAIAHIAAYRADHALSPASIAQSMNISTRQLQRMFAAISSTPSHEIRRQRAELAASMLKDPVFRAFNVSEVARRSGFADGPELRRAFGALGYPMPTELRNGAS